MLSSFLARDSERPILNKILAPSQEMRELVRDLQVANQSIRLCVVRPKCEFYHSAGPVDSQFRHSNLPQPLCSDGSTFAFLHTILLHPLSVIVSDIRGLLEETIFA